MKVGEYVITNDRLHIGKIYNINEFREPSMMYAIDFPNADDFVFMGENDFKSSPNIIDLTEVGDYVNGLKIDDITEKDIDHPERIVWYLTYYGDDDIPFRNDEIKSIVTKEQFEAMEYKVEV